MDLPMRAVSTLAVALVALAATPALMAQQRADTPRSEAETSRVAVMPFTNITGGAGDEWIGAGIAESFLTDLQGRPALAVVSLARIADAVRAVDGDALARQGDRALEVGRRVGARWLVSGAYQRLGDQLRITGRFVEVGTGTVVRSAKVDGALAQLFELQDRIVAELVDGASTGGGSIARTPPPSPPTQPAPTFVAPAQEAPLDRTPPAVAAPARPPVPPRPAAASIVSPDNERGASVAAGEPGAVAEAGFSVAGLLGAIDAPPPPIAPEVISRDERGRATVRAIKLTEGIRLDGVLDEPVYRTVAAITGFVQLMPNEGAPVTERTEAWIMFDSTNIYVSGRLWDSAPPGEWVANEMRRDTSQLRDNDSFWVVFDTFYDRRNGVAFHTNPLGAIGDFAITNEGNPNSDWNPVWDVRTGRFEGGWTVEMEIPFKSLRYRPGPTQVWGVQLRRTIRRKNELAFLTPVPIAAGRRGIFRLSDAATMVGLEVPGAGNTLDIKPYGITGLTTDVSASPPTRNAGDGDVGLDIKYGITQNLTADLTYNTDFAQVEADEQQVNLTRFSLFFPEKREFFLEGQGIFNFARGGGPSPRDSALRQEGGGSSRSSFGGGNAPTLFYSRRIGLESGIVVPIVGGGRVTGKAGAFDVGALNIQTDDDVISGAETTNFTVVRVKRDILRRSSIGALFTNRSVSVVGDGSNQAYGADATFSFYDNVSLLAYIARTETPGLGAEDMSYQGQFTYAGDRYGFQAEHLVVEDNFVPEVGFVRRDNFRRSYGTGRFSPRPRSIEAIRQFRLEGSFDYILTADTGQVETRQTQLGFSTEFENSDRVGVSVADNYELLVEPFEPGPGLTLPVGGYRFRDVEATFSPGAQRRLTGTFTIRVGEYFSGDIRSVGFSRGRLALTQQLSVEPTLSVNWIDTPQGAFRTELVVSRVTYTFTPRMFFSGLIQYNSATDTISNNLRLRWEYSPGSELFVVYTEEQNTDPLRPDRFSELRKRGLVVKVTRLFRF